MAAVSEMPFSDYPSYISHLALDCHGDEDLGCSLQSVDLQSMSNFQSPFTSTPSSHSPSEDSTMTAYTYSSSGSTMATQPRPSQFPSYFVPSYPGRVDRETSFPSYPVPQLHYSAMLPPPSVLRSSHLPNQTLPGYNYQQPRPSFASIPPTDHSVDRPRAIHPTRRRGFLQAEQIRADYDQDHVFTSQYFHLYPKTMAPMNLWPENVMFPVLSCLLDQHRWSEVLILRKTCPMVRAMVDAWIARQEQFDLEQFIRKKDIYIMQMERDNPRFFPLTSNRAAMPATKLARGRKRGPNAPVEKKWENKIVGGLGCYICHTIKAPEFFEKSSIMPTVDEGKPKGKKGGAKKGVGRRKDSPRLPVLLPDIPSPASTYHAAAARSPSVSSSTTERRQQAPPEKPERAPKVRRFCIECGVKKGFIKQGELLWTASAQPTAQKMWVCDCPAVYSQAISKCDKCGRHEVFSLKEREDEGGRMDVDSDLKEESDYDD